MKNIIRIVSASVLLTLLFMYACFAAESDEYVRVRIRTPRQFNEQAELDGYDNITVYDVNNDASVGLFQIDSEISILMDSYYDKYFNFLSNNSGGNALVGPYHVKIENKKYSSFLEIQNAIKLTESTAGMTGFYPYYNGIDYEICIGSYIEQSTASSVSEKLIQNGLSSTVINGNKKNIVVYDNRNEIAFMYSNNSNVYFTSNNSGLSCDMIKIDSKPYRGMMAFNIINDSTLISINRLDVESYLYGVVPCESPSSWPKEALKAQTLAARTYVLKNLNPNDYYGYDVEDSTLDQVYGGYSSEYASTNQAVDETRGEKIYYNNQLIDAVFHSTSGGSTENSENIWANELPYLRGVEDSYSNISPITEWKEVYTKDYIISRLKLYGNNVSELNSIEISKISVNNRVQECIFNTDIGKITYTKDKIRSVFGLKSLWFTINDGNSSGSTGSSGKEFNFIYQDAKDVTSKGEIIGSVTDNTPKSTGTVNGKYIISSSSTSKMPEDSSTLSFISSTGTSVQENRNTTTSSGGYVSTGSEYTFNGRGWGHGLGLSQYGAKEMATEGFTYDQIIKHYYTGVNIK